MAKAVAGKLWRSGPAREAAGRAPENPQGIPKEKEDWPINGNNRCNSSGLGNTQEQVDRGREDPN